ncbi:MAG: penicillin-binding protein 2 [Actinomycetota bacterium]|nr:penicillin-binding protein 2 [Actinomycetota bacterium]
MNRQIKGVGLVMMVLFLALFVQVNYLQIIKAEDLNKHPANTRAIVRDFSRPRGVIQTSDGVVLAQSVPTDNEFERLRQYPEGDLFSHLTGFFSFNFGADGLERTYNGDLVGRDQQFELEKLSDLLVKKERVGDVTLTVSKRVQQIATEQLGDRKGAVVALDPTNGAILAMADYPRFDPNLLSGHNQAEVKQAWDALNADPDKPLLPRAYRERYFPGSAFKVVTTATALATGVATTTQPVYPQLSSLPLPQASQPLGNFGGGTCGGPLPIALAVSCNTAFAQLGMDLGPERLASGAEGFGFGKEPPLDLPGPAASNFPSADDLSGNKPVQAKSAIGQQDVQTTPLQMALIAAAIGNGGVIMTPHLMSEVRNSEGVVIKSYEPRPWVEAVPADVAATTRDLMVGVVQAGTGTRAQIPGMLVGGKTGTAQTGLDTNHVWFVGFAPADAPKVAVAVMLEDLPVASEGTGGALAAPIAKAVMEAVLFSG